MPAAIFAIQTYGEQLNWHPHLHSLLADGAWGKSDATQPRKTPIVPEVCTRVWVVIGLDYGAGRAYSLNRKGTLSGDSRSLSASFHKYDEVC